MRQLTFLSPGRLEWREVPDARIQASDDALVRPVAATTCDLDQMILRGEAPFSGPLALGHECVAEIIELGDARRWRLVSRTARGGALARLVLVL